MSGRCSEPPPQPESPHKAWPIPARVDDLVLADGRVLFVGDAAGATDPMSGEGIGQALATGRLGRRGAARGGQRPTRSSPRARYEATVRTRAGRRPPAGRRALRHPRLADGHAADDGHDRADPLDPAQLRPVDVRGLPEGDPGHTGAMAPADAHRIGRLLPRLTRALQRSLEPDRTRRETAVPIAHLPADTDSDAVTAALARDGARHRRPAWHRPSCSTGSRTSWTRISPPPRPAPTTSAGSTPAGAVGSSPGCRPAASW